jgi:hypothetical protein
LLNFFSQKINGEVVLFRVGVPRDMVMTQEFRPLHDKIIAVLQDHCQSDAWITDEVKLM